MKYFNIIAAIIFVIIAIAEFASDNKTDGLIWLLLSHMFMIHEKLDGLKKYNK